DVRRQVMSLRNTVGMLRDAAQAMDNERIELQGFLDGSHDALQRLEEWVGQQMGLDLRRSPETVRNYLPLSVIWVTTTRLKKLIALLNSSGRNLTLTQEQIDETLAQFRSTLDSLSRMSASFGVGGPTPDGGFSATVAQINWAPSSPSASMPAVEALGPGQRAELERSVREDLRRSLEDEVRQEIAADIRREEEQRIRQELEVQIRRQMMFSALGPGMGDSSVSVTGGGVEVRPQARAAHEVQVTNEQSPEMLEVFREEAQEHLQTITSGIADLERAPGDTNAIQTVRRAMHTLKGAAGMMGFVAVQSLAHASEDLLDQLAEHGRPLSAGELSLVFDTAETLDQLITGGMSGRQQREIAQPLIDRYATLTGTAPLINLLDSSDEEVTAESVAIDLGGDPDDASAARSAEDLSVRIKLSKLDELVTLFGDLLVNRSIFEERVGRIYQLVGDSAQASERLREVGSQLETQFETFMLPSGQSGAQTPAGQMPAGFRFPWSAPRSGANNAGAPGHLQDFHELELDRYTEFHRLSRILSEAVTDVLSLNHEMETLIREIQVSFARETRLSSEVQDRLLKARLVPVSSLAPRLYRAARASALKEGKEVEFFVEGGDTEVDRKVIEEVEGPLLHLVRNSVNHGIERPDARMAKGKPRAGKITIAAAYEGNQVVIDVRDDGAGIDPQKVRQTAITRGWIDGYANLSDHDALNLIFQPGVSTAETLTEESGRGVGLDVVRDAASRLKGSVDVDSTVGVGSIFTLKFPISLQIARAVLVKAGKHTYAIPMAVVDQIGRLDYYERVSSPTPAVVVRNERYALARLSTYLKTPAAPLDERSSLLIINAGRRKVALVVDGIVSQQEIVAKPLGAHLRDVRGVAGATALGNGQVVIILELLELLAQPIEETLTLPVPGQRSDAATPYPRPGSGGLSGALSAPSSRPQPPAPSSPASAPFAAPQPAAQPYSAPAVPPVAPFPFASPGAPPQPPFGAPTEPQTPAAQWSYPAAPQPSSASQWGYPTPEERSQQRPVETYPTAALPSALPGVQNGSQNGAQNGAQNEATQRPPWAAQPAPAPLAPPQSAPPMGPSGRPTASTLGQRDFVVAQRSANNSGLLDAPASAKQSYLLVVDDSPSVRRVVGGMLKAHGWETQTARDGVEALDVIARERPAAVLLDIEMPRMDGYELMATLRSDPQYRNLPLIVLTSRAAAKHQQRATQLGANAYIVKPYQDEFLLSTIADLVRRSVSGAL
ncbi:MAG TPA: response regulator, partial [Ktedonobacterales bacterium]|nr:response regulator [Ktedonobacterales bacterium]